MRIASVAINEYGDHVVKCVATGDLWVNPRSNEDDFYGSWRVDSVEQAWELCDLLRKHRQELKDLNLPKTKI